MKSRLHFVWIWNFGAYKMSDKTVFNVTTYKIQAIYKQRIGIMDILKDIDKGHDPDQR